VVMASLTAKYFFSASHRLHTPALSELENARVFGKCNNPYGHGHNYELEVTVRGPVDLDTGLVVNRKLLDEYVQERVVNRFAYRNINLDIPELKDLVPTTENLVNVIAHLLRTDWAAHFGMAGPAPTRLHIQETGRNGFELLMSERNLRPGADKQRNYEER
jgi:6-pyruvoyltetrahydropterin/6-carboxytetrahydropterin synthase